MYSWPSEQAVLSSKIKFRPLPLDDTCIPFILLRQSAPISLSTLLRRLPCYTSSSALIIPSRLLTSLKLLKVPPTNIQIAIILIHTVRKCLDIVCTRASGVLLGAGVGVGVVHLAGLGVVVYWLLVLFCWLSCLGGTAAEESADCVAD